MNNDSTKEEAMRARKGRVGVKALVWEDFDGMGARASGFYQANYLITVWRGRGQFEVAMSYPGYETGYDGERFHDTLEAAKAAAQADYEARILAALDPAPAERCAECDCRHGGVECNWIAQQPAPDHARIPALEQALEAMSEALASYQRSIAGERALKKGQTND